MSAWLPLVMAGVPRELRALGWVGWRAEPTAKGKPKKPAYQIAAPREFAANNNPEHWRNEGDVREVQLFAPELFTGFGVALMREARLAFIDLDDVRDPDTGAIKPWAMRMVEIFDSWTEISASGTGLHIFVRGRLPGSGLNNFLDGDPDAKLEVYSEGRFAYLTGHALEPGRPLAERQDLVTKLARHVVPARTPAGAPAPASRGDAPIPQGQRNDALFRIARGFVLKGLTGPALEQALVAVSRRRCVPVPPDADVIKIARHAERLADRPA